MRARQVAAITALTAGALLLVLGPARAGARWKWGEKGKEYREKCHEEYVEELDLTPEQMEQFTKQREESRSAMEGLRDSIREKHRELRDELDSETTDSEKLESIVSDLKDLESRRIDRKVESIIRMKEILTPEQFQKMQSLRKKHWKGGHGKRWRKGHRGWDADEKGGQEGLPETEAEEGASE